uniref:Uncharacterized protein n=1 Tax=Arundo donax TaxID=35708 RepID=A0A0A8YIY0_ARUDO
MRPGGIASTDSQSGGRPWPAELKGSAWKQRKLGADMAAGARSAATLRGVETRVMAASGRARRRRPARDVNAERWPWPGNGNSSKCLVVASAIVAGVLEWTGEQLTLH